MRVPFTKMHGLGNDFIVLDGRDNAMPELNAAMVAALADRRTGIGCDQLILLESSERNDFRMRIFNADGGEVEACGNAARAVALFHGSEAQVETAGGAIALQPGEGGATVDMGTPRFEWDAIPLAYAMDTLAMPVSWEELSNPVAVNVGNPHVVFFVESLSAIDLETLGSRIENDPLFPQRINVNVAVVRDRSHVELKVWERGVGLTRACGTGACATAVAAMRLGKVERTVGVSLPGGDLSIAWGEDNHIAMTGPATRSFEGVFDTDDFA